MINEEEGREVEWPCCLGQGEVIGLEGKRLCPLCEGYQTVPKEVHDRFLEVATRRLPKGTVSVGAASESQPAALGRSPGDCREGDSGCLCGT